MAANRRGWSRTVVAASAVISIGALGGIVGKVWASALRAKTHPVTLVAGPGVTPFVQGLYDLINTAYLPGFQLTQRETLGSWELTFHGEDANEAENVALCVQALDGAVIAPGAIFSYNDTVGERTEERGFRPGLMYVAGQVVTGMGGGVCIPSTALYNAALKADMEIVERYNHSGPVSYATPGLDAAVVYGLKDLRFRNTSDAPVVLHAGVIGNSLTISVSGKPTPGRRVEVERTGFAAIPFEETATPDPTVPAGEPQVKQEGRDGWTATVVRTVYQGKKVVRRETLSEDTVAPRARILLVNPLDIPDSPEALAAAEAAQTAEKPADAAVAGKTAAPHVSVDPPAAGRTHTPASTDKQPHAGKPAADPAHTPANREAGLKPAPTHAEPIEKAVPDAHAPEHDQKPIAPLTPAHSDS